MLIKKSRLTFSTLGCPDWDFERILAEAAKLRYDTIEMRGVDRYIDVDSIPELQPENRTYTHELLKQYGIKICALDCSASFVSISNRNRAYDECKFAIEAAAELRVPFIRVFGGSFNGMPEREAVANISDGLREICRYASGSGVDVLLETHDDVKSIARIQHILESVGESRLGILWDIEHTYAAGEDSAEFAAQLLPVVKHIHLKDMDADGKLCLPGDGVLKLTEFVQMLDNMGYQGLYSLEWEKRWNPQLAEPELAFRQYREILCNMSFDNFN